MIKIIKKVGLVFGVLILLLVLAAVIIPMVVDVNSFKPQIAEAVRKQTGREIQIGGDIKLKILPRFSLELRDITLSNAAGFAPESMAKVGRVSVGVAVWPLLRKEIQVSRVVIDNVELHYAINADGVTNIDDILSRRTKPEEEAPAETPSAEGKKGAFTPDALKIALLHISNMNISYMDARTDARYTLSDINLKAENVRMDAPVGITFSGVLEEPASEMRVNADFAIMLTAGKEQAYMDIRNGLIEAKIPLQGLDVTMDMRAAAAYDLGKQFVNLTDATVEGTVDCKKDNLTVDGRFTVHTNGTFDLVGGIFTVPSVKIGSEFTGSMLHGKQTASFETSVIFNKKEGTLDVRELKADVLGVHLAGALSGTGMMSAPDIKGSMIIDEFSLRDILAQVKADYKPSDPSALTALKASSAFTFHANVLNLPLQIKLDTTNIETALKVDVSGKKPVINADITLDGVNVDRYLPASAPAAAAKTPPVQKAPPAKITIPDIDIDLTPLPVVNATLRAQKITVMKNDLQNINVKAALDNGVANVNASVGNLYGGQANTAIRVTGRKSLFEAALDATLSSINIHDALKVNIKDFDSATIPKKGSVMVSAMFKDKVLNVSKLNITADSLTVTGNLKGDFTPKDKPMITFLLNVGDVNVRNFFPKTDSAKSPAAASSTSSAARQEPLDLNSVPVNADGTIRVNSVTMDQYKARNIVIKVSLINGTATVSPFSAQIFGGEVVANGTVTSRNGKLPSNLRLNINEIQLGDLIATVTERKSNVDGLFTASGDLSVVGITKDEILQSLTGEMNYIFTKGVIRGFGYDPKNLSLSNIKDLVMLDPNKSTSLNDVKGSVSFKDGRMNLQKISMKSNNLSGTLEGGIVMKDLAMDLSGRMNVEGVDVPVRITGAMQSPKVWIDMEQLISGLLKKYADDAAKRIGGEVQKNIQDEVEKGLKNLFK